MTERMERPAFAEINPIDEYTEVRSSGIQGYGLYASKLIPEGFAWFDAREQDVLILSPEQYRVFYGSFIPPLSYTPRLLRQFSRCLVSYCFYHTALDSLIFCLDNARYVNHSETPNSRQDQPGIRSVALRDIQPGEEITEDYRLYPKGKWVKADPLED